MDQQGRNLGKFAKVVTRGFNCCCGFNYLDLDVERVTRSLES